MHPLQPAIPCLQVGMGAMECYERDFEDFMLKDTAEYYRRKAAVWIQVGGRVGAPSACVWGVGGRGALMFLLV